MNDPSAIKTITLPLRGDGTALENKQGVSSFDLVNVELVGSGKVSWVPDPDNDANTIFWVQGAGPADSGLPAQGSVVLKLTYPAL